MSCYEFFARAVQGNWEELDAQSLTEQIDTALEMLGNTDEAQTAAVAVGRCVAAAVDEES